MIIAILDAQGAGLGKQILKKICKEIPNRKAAQITIAALATNEAAASNMIKAGADMKISGETAICNYLKNSKIDCIIGPIGILCSGGINGEITDKISRCVFCVECKKYILPLHKHGIYIPGTIKLQIKDMIDDIICDIKRTYNL